MMFAGRGECVSSDGPPVAVITPFAYDVPVLRYARQTRDACIAGLLAVPMETSSADAAAASCFLNAVSEAMWAL